MEWQLEVDEAARRLATRELRFLGVTVPRQIGKTFGAARSFIRCIYRDKAAGRGMKISDDYRLACESLNLPRLPKLHYWVVAPTYSLTEQIWREILSAIHPALIDDYKESKGQLWLRGDILIERKSGEHPERLVSAALAGVLIDEAARLKPNAWKNLRPTLNATHGWAILLTTPCGRNWYYKDVAIKGMKERDEYNKRYLHIHRNHLNTKLPKWILDEIKQAEIDLPTRYFKRDMLAEFVAFTGQVYEDFDLNVHVIKDAPRPIEYEEVIGGYDKGFSNPGALILFGKHKGRWIAFKEYHRRRKLPNWWKEKVIEAKDKYRMKRVWCDPSSPRDIELFFQTGVEALPANNAVDDGLRFCSTMLHQRRVFFTKNVSKSVDDIVGYHYKEVRGYMSEEPAKIDDHGADAFRYAMFSEEGQEAVESFNFQ